jgi:hypothetical protein
MNRALRNIKVKWKREKGEKGEEEVEGGRWEGGR